MADHNLHKQNVLDATSGPGLLHKTEKNGGKWIRECKETTLGRNIHIHVCGMSYKEEPINLAR